MHKLNNIFHWAGNGAAGAHAVQPPRGWQHTHATISPRHRGWVSPSQPCPLPIPGRGASPHPAREALDARQQLVFIIRTSFYQPAPPPCKLPREAEPKSGNFIPRACSAGWRTSPRHPQTPCIILSALHPLDQPPGCLLPPRLARAALSPAARCPRLLSQPVPRDGRSKIFHALLSSPAFPLASFSPVSPS